MNQQNDIEQPKHYAKFPIEPIRFILENQLGYCEGNIVKYICRYKLKHTSKMDQLKDLRKARQYLDILIGRFINDCDVNVVVKNEQHK